MILNGVKYDLVDSTDPYFCTNCEFTEFNTTWNIPMCKLTNMLNWYGKSYRDSSLFSWDINIPPPTIYNCQNNYYKDDNYDTKKIWIKSQSDVRQQKLLKINRTR